MGSNVSELGFEVSGLGFQVSGLGLEVPVVSFDVSGLGVEVSVLGFEASGLGFKVRTGKRTAPTLIAYEFRVSASCVTGLQSFGIGLPGFGARF